MSNLISSLTWAGAGGSPPTINPGDYSPTGWYRASFTGDPWTPTAGSGSSGSNGNLADINHGGAPSAVGNSFNGYTVCTLVPNAAMSTVNGPTTFIAVTAMTVIVLARVNSTVSAGTNYYDDAALVSESNGNMGLAFSASGVRAGIFDSGVKQTTAVSQATGSWFMAAMRFASGGHVKCRVNSTDATNVSTPSNSSGFGASFLVARNWDASKYLDCDIAEVLTWQTSLADADVAAIYSGYFKLRYPAMALP